MSNQRHCGHLNNDFREFGSAPKILRAPETFEGGGGHLKSEGSRGLPRILGGTWAT